MKCADLMNLDLRVLPTSASVRQAAILMRDSSLGFLPVCDDAGRAVGVVTDRDIAVRAATGERSPGDVPVIEAMSAPPIVCGEHEEVAAAEHRMIANGVSRLVVVDGDGVAVGIVSLTDLLNKGPGWRAVAVARAVLAREAQGPHVPVQGIYLTPGDYPAVAADHETRSDAGLDAVLAGGSTHRGMKEFPG